MISTARLDRSHRGAGLGPTAIRVLSTYGLPVVLVALIAIFSGLLPNTFFTHQEFRSLTSQQSVVVLVALAVTVPMAAGQFDLSVGYWIGLAHILTIGFQVNQGLPWPVAVLCVLALGALIGLLNGVLVTHFHIDSFIATLGVSFICFGVSEWYTGGQQVIKLNGSLPRAFLDVAGTAPGGIPTPAIFTLVICVCLWIAFEYLPIGRYFYVLGANPRAAELTGIQARRYVPLSFMVSGVLTAVGGVTLASLLRVGQPSVGPEYLLPAFAGALLGATAIRPGRVNVWGTVVAVFMLAVAVAGLEQEGVRFFIEPLFEGAMLVVAVALAVYAARRRLAAAATHAVSREELPPGE